MNLREVSSFLTSEVSGLRAKNAVAAIARHHRIQASPGYDDAVQFIVKELDSAGISSTVSSYIADGKTKTFGWVSPPGWRIESGRLMQLSPTERALADFDPVQVSILGQSGAGEGEGELIHVETLESEDDLSDIDLSGKFLLTTSRPASTLRWLEGKGLAGLIVYPDSRRAAASYELVQYAGLFPAAKQLDWVPMGFSISRRTADGLLKDLAKGPIRVRGYVDAEFLDHPMQVLEARIPGAVACAPEVLLVAHLCHPAPSANDNASGSGLLVEIARVLQALSARGDLANSIRLIWVPEFNGAIPWAAANAESLERVAFCINLDMVGQSPELIGEPLRVFRVPNSHPSFLNACFEPLLSQIASDPGSLADQGSRRVLHWILDTPSGGSDHLVFQAPPIGVPSVMFGHDDPYWHTNLDTLEKVDPTRLKCVGILTACLACLPSWSGAEASALVEWVSSFAHRALAEASRLARSADDVTGVRLLDTALSVEQARVRSLAEFMPDDWDASNLLESLSTTHRIFRHRLSGEGSSEPPNRDARPVRIMEGPVRYSLMQEILKEDRDFLAETLFSHHGAPPQVLANLADGTRTIDEISAHLSLDFKTVYDSETIHRAVRILKHAGYLRDV